MAGNWRRPALAPFLALSELKGRVALAQRMEPPVAPLLSNPCAPPRTPRVAAALRRKWHIYNCPFPVDGSASATTDIFFFAAAEKRPLPSMLGDVKEVAEEQLRHSPLRDAFRETFSRRPRETLEFRSPRRRCRLEAEASTGSGKMRRIRPWRTVIRTLNEGLPFSFSASSDAEFLPGSFLAAVARDL